jgi:hypothetical protein
MYKLWHRLFGWDYVYWSYGYDAGISRVFELEDGTVVYWRSRIWAHMGVVKTEKSVLWLTCHPSKYGFGTV